MNWKITAFYHFHHLSEEELSQVEQRMVEFANQSDLNGLVIMASEGLNGTVAGSSDTIASFKELIRSFDGFAETVFKDSRAESKPFKRFKTKHRDEIVTIKRTDFVPTRERNGHLSAAEWHRVLSEEDDFVLIDTRNNYETAIGVFEGAVDPDLEMFSEFGEWVKHSEIPKDKKVLMYCTGGIRCEKAILEMQEQGYENVFQLHGGILKYLEEYPEGKFKGECFVFDHRVAVNKDLLPSDRYRLCPHCGNPGDQKVSCCRCHKDAVICETCAQTHERNTCSKDCAHHVRVQSQAA